MIAASSLAFPGSKTLSVWWSQLARFKPVQMWVGHLFVHRLQALAEVVQTEAVNPLHLVLLRAVDQERRCEENISECTTGALPPHLFLERLDQHLHLSPGLIGRLLEDLHREGLLTYDPIPALTEIGRAALSNGSYSTRRWQRREVTFVERLRPDGSRLLAPHFLALAGSDSQRWQPDTNLPFDFAWLQQSAHQSPEWRATFAFPGDIQNFADPADPSLEQPPMWQRVTIDQPERLLLAAIAVGKEVPANILFFAARQDGWELRADKSIGTLGWSGRQEFPDLAEPPNWSKAWQSWCQTRHYPPQEVAASTLTQMGHRLNLTVPSALKTRLQAAKSELVKGDTWLLAGEGYLRAAANVRLQGS